MNGIDQPRARRAVGQWKNLLLLEVKTGDARADPETPVQARDPLIPVYEGRIYRHNLGDILYQKAAERRLSYDFPHISLPSLRSVLLANGNNYAPACETLRRELAQDVWTERTEALRLTATDFPTTGPIISSNPNAKNVTQLRLLMHTRRFAAVPPLPARLRAELEWLRERYGDALPAFTSPTSGTTSPGAALRECEICCEEKPTRDFVSCQGDHVFCTDCVRKEAKERVHGQGAGSFSCLDRDCAAGFGRRLLARVLDAGLMAQMEELEMEQALAAATLAQLERCPWCRWGAVVETLVEEDMVFRCQNKGVCGKASCRLCKAVWDKDHRGRRCPELETDSETMKRKRLEEALTAAILRRCHKCGLQFQKVEGCNKMTCNCGASSCYLCRKPDINYGHFCPHRWEPGQKKCKECTACRLYEDPSRIDQLRLEQARQLNNGDPSQACSCQ